MRVKLRTINSDTFSLTDVWHRWFAWHPVVLDRKSWVWLEWVDRKSITNSGDGRHCRAWNYRRLRGVAKSNA